jgi:hypothetical protein
MSKVVRVLASPDSHLQRTMGLLVDWGVPQDPFHEGLCGHEQLQTKGRKAQGQLCGIPCRLQGNLLMSTFSSCRRSLKLWVWCLHSTHIQKVCFYSVALRKVLDVTVPLFPPL